MTFEITSLRHFYQLDKDKDGRIRKDESAEAVKTYDVEGPTPGGFHLDVSYEAVEIWEFLSRLSEQRRREVLGPSQIKTWEADEQFFAYLLKNMDCHILEEFKKSGPKMIPLLGKALKSQDAAVRTGALVAIDGMATGLKGHLDRASLSLIADNFSNITYSSNNCCRNNDTSYGVLPLKARQAAASILATVGGQALPYLEKALSSDDEMVLGAAIYAFHILAYKHPRLVSDKAIGILINNFGNKTKLEANPNTRDRYENIDVHARLAIHNLKEWAGKTIVSKKADENAKIRAQYLTKRLAKVDSGFHDAWPRQ